MRHLMSWKSPTSPARGDAADIDASQTWFNPHLSRLRGRSKSEGDGRLRSWEGDFCELPLFRSRVVVPSDTGPYPCSNRPAGVESGPGLDVIMGEAVHMTDQITPPCVR